MIIKSERMKNIPFSGIRKMFEEANLLQKEGADIIHLELGRPDFDTPKHIKEAAKKAIDMGYVHYTSNYGIPQLRKVIASKLKNDNELEYDEEKEIIVTVGTNEAVLMAMLGLLDPGDEVLIPDPSWLHYMYCTRIAGAVPVPLKLTFNSNNGFSLDPKTIVKAITPKTRMLVIVSPHNPTGMVLSKEILEEISRIAIYNNLIVVSDEIYEKIIYNGVKHYSIASFTGMKERTVVLNGLSKAYSMTGWRIGYAAASIEIIDAMIRIHQYSTVCAVSFAQYGAIVALESSQDCVQKMVEEFERRRNLVVEGLRSIKGITCYKPQGAFYVFPSIQIKSMSSEEIAKRLLHEAHVVVVPGSAFGQYGEGFVRIAYSNSYDNIANAIKRMKVFFDKYIS